MSYSRTEDETTGTVEVTMPNTGSSRGATVVAWLKRPGEEVDADEPICLVSWDEVTAEVGSPAAGVLRMLAVAPGDAVPVGTSLAVIDVGMRSRDMGEPEPERAPAAEPAPVPEPGPVAEPESPRVGVQAATAAAEADARLAPKTLVPESLIRNAPIDDAGRIEPGQFLSPAVRRFAREHDVDPRQVAGSGRDGRVSLRDLAAGD